MKPDPKLLMLGGVGLVVVFMLLRNKGSSTSGQNIGSFQTTGLTTPVGQSYQYLDGQGIQHLIATDPNGNLTGYNTVPPGTGYPQTGQLSGYVGMMGSGQYVQPYGGFTAAQYSRPTSSISNPVWMTQPTGDIAYEQ